MLARAVVANEAGTLKPGLFVSGAVSLDPVPVALAVQSDAIQMLDGKPVVFVREGDRFETRGNAYRVCVEPEELGDLGHRARRELVVVDLEQIALVGGAYDLAAPDRVGDAHVHPRCLHHRLPHIWRAALEGVVYGFRHSKLRSESP